MGETEMGETGRNCDLLSNSLFVSVSHCLPVLAAV